MTEEKKEELRQLLEEAMENLRILKLFERDNLTPCANTDCAIHPLFL